MQTQAPPALMTFSTGRSVVAQTHRRALERTHCIAYMTAYCQDCWTGSLNRVSMVWCPNHWCRQQSWGPKTVPLQVASTWSASHSRRTTHSSRRKCSSRLRCSCAEFFAGHLRASGLEYVGHSPQLGGALQRMSDPNSFLCNPPNTSAFSGQGLQVCAGKSLKLTTAGISPKREQQRQHLPGHSQRAVEPSTDSQQGITLFPFNCTRL